MTPGPTENKSDIKTIIQAYEYDLPVLSPDGSKCTIVKIKTGKAKIRRIQKGMVQEAWVTMENLRTA